MRLLCFIVACLPYLRKTAGYVVFHVFEEALIEPKLCDLGKIMLFNSLRIDPEQRFQLWIIDGVGVDGNEEGSEETALLRS